MEYGCIGEKLGHSFSKEIHCALADYSYELKEIPRNELNCFMLKREFKAINVTIPYKQDVIPYLDYISPEAKAINAVNTIVNRDGRLYGYNTDYYGLKALILKENVDIKGKKVAILGSGGTSNTAFALCKDSEAAVIKKVSRSEKAGYITYDELYSDFSDCEIIINTTPCGMYPNNGISPICLERLPSVQAVFDAVYNPLFSKLCLDAKKKGIIAAGGLYMLVSQGAYAVEHFIGTSVDSRKVLEIYEKLFKEKMNIVLIGMPSCGKTTVGNLLSEALKKQFADTDLLVEKSENMPIPEIFENFGEAYFRKCEKQAVFELSKENSRVIATGGGVVLNSENIENLKGNGRIYFIDRPLNLLISTADRPLSSNSADLEKRYNERYELYKSSAHVIIDGSGTPEEVKKRIEADFIEYSCN